MDPACEQWLVNKIADTRTRTECDRVFTLFATPEDDKWERHLQSPEDARALIELLEHTFPECQGLRITLVQVQHSRFTRAWSFALAEELRRLPQLRLLDLGNLALDDNGLKTLAAHLSSYRHLRELHLQDTLIGDSGLLALAQHSSYLTHLEVLTLRGTRITSEGIRALVEHGEPLKALKDIDLAYTCDADRSFDLFVTHAKHFPQMRRLHFNGTLVGDGNLHTLVKHAEDLPNLEHLELDTTSVTNAGIKAFAQAAHVFENLRTLKVSGTCENLPCTSLDFDSSAACCKYLREHILPERKELAQFKLLVVGQAEVGKTHLVKRLIPIPGTQRDLESHRPYYDHNAPRTHNVECTTLFNLLSPFSDASRLRSAMGHVWDFGGQNELHTTHRLFLGNKYCFYLLVLRADLPADGDDVVSNRLSYWLRTIAYHGQGLHDGKPTHAPVVIAVTQCDRIALDSKLARPYKRLLDALNVAKANHWYGANVVAEPVLGLGWSDDIEAIVGSGISHNVRQQDLDASQRLCRAIESNIAQVPSIARCLPPPFFVMLRRIEHMFAVGTLSRWRETHSLPYFDCSSNSAIVDLCKQYGLGEEELNEYLSLLNDLGMVLWLGGNEDMPDDTDAVVRKRVFNPNWVRGPVYKLIRHVPSLPGIVTALDTRRLLPEQSQDEVNERDASESTTSLESDAGWLYRQLAFTADDRDCILALMKAGRLAYRRRNQWLIPDTLQPIPIGHSERQYDPFRKITPVRLKARFLPEKVFLSLVAECYPSIRDPKEECFRNEMLVHTQVKAANVPVLLRVVVSPPDGRYPYLEVFAASKDKKEREEVITRVDERVRGIYEREFGNDELWLGRVNEDPHSKRKAKVRSKESTISEAETAKFEHWGDATIALHTTEEGAKYYCYNRSLHFGEIVYLGRRRPLNIPGEQWPKLIRLFAMSPGGNRALIDDIDKAFYAKQQKLYRANRVEAEIQHDEERKRKLDRERDERVRKAMATLSQTLKEETGHWESKPWSSKVELRYYYAAFKVGVLEPLTDEEQKKRRKRGGFQFRRETG